MNFGNLDFFLVVFWIFAHKLFFYMDKGYLVWDVMILPIYMLFHGLTRLFISKAQEKPLKPTFIILLHNRSLPDVCCFSLPWEWFLDAYAWWINILHFIFLFLQYFCQRGFIFNYFSFIFEMDVTPTLVYSIL